ncbi:hypothetical protein [Nitrosomonas sp.]|uniref:hypothetical protein n=1 Tax=Nitrosomonas sp. TaxID=42353 RepID=UPI00262E2B5C|nr:hypothetical protein [Nitrosomonas sp.]
MRNINFNGPHRMVTIGILLIVSVTGQSGCSTQQLYNTGQSWQRNECNRLMDQLERERCLSNAGTSYEAYKKQSTTGNEQK